MKNFSLIPLIIGLSLMATACGLEKPEWINPNPNPNSDAKAATTESANTEESASKVELALEEAGLEGNYLDAVVSCHEVDDPESVTPEMERYFSPAFTNNPFCCQL